MRKRPIFHFETETETGIHEVPNGSTISITNYQSQGSSLFTKKNDTNVTPTTTIQEAVTAGNLISANKEDATTIVAGLMSAADKTKLNGIATGANNYVLPAATATVFGGVKASLSGTTLTLNF